MRRLSLSLVFCIFGIFPGYLFAHPNLQNAMWAQFEPGLVRVAVNVSVKEITVAQDAKLEDGQPMDIASLQTAAEAHASYVQTHLTLSADGLDLPVKLKKVTPPSLAQDPETTFFQYEMEFALGERKPAGIVFYHHMLEEWPYAVGTAWDVSYVLRSKRSDSPEVAVTLLRAKERTTIATGWGAPSAGGSEVHVPGVWSTFVEYGRHGIMHILTGYDHLLFVGALVIATVSLWEMVWVILAFTAAHTLTLTLSVFNIVRLPSLIVEPIIAASIVFVALENVVSPKRAHSRSRLIVAFGFGLVHGLGFAGGLLEAMEGLPAIGIWVALAAFSIGVEVGHQAVVLPLYGMLALVRRKSSAPAHSRIARWGSAVISCCGAYYLVVAIHEQFR